MADVEKRILFVFLNIIRLSEGDGCFSTGRSDGVPFEPASCGFVPIRTVHACAIKNNGFSEITARGLHTFLVYCPFPHLGRSCRVR